MDMPSKWEKHQEVTYFFTYSNEIKRGILALHLTYGLLTVRAEGALWCDEKNAGGRTFWMAAQTSPLMCMKYWAGHLTSLSPRCCSFFHLIVEKWHILYNEVEGIQFILHFQSACHPLKSLLHQQSLWRAASCRANHRELNGGGCAHWTPKQLLRRLPMIEWRIQSRQWDQGKQDSLSAM